MAKRARGARTDLRINAAKHDVRIEADKTASTVRTYRERMGTTYCRVSFRQRLLLTKSVVSNNANVHDDDDDCVQPCTTDGLRRVALPVGCGELDSTAPSPSPSLT